MIEVNGGRTEWHVLPWREADTHWNVLKSLEQGPCTDCLKIENIHPSGNGTVLCDIEIKHPFSNANLTGFDVRGIAMFTGSHVFPVSGLNMPDRTLGDGELVNADGYTTLYNISTLGSGPDGMQGYFQGKLASASPPNALLNGFKRFVSDDPANTRNVFYAGDTVTVTYEIDLPDGAFVFGYAVDACWAPPISKPVDDPMTDFGPDANCEEPWQVSVSVISIGQGLNDEGGEARAIIDVYDRQGKDSHLPPKLECSELFDGEPMAVFKEMGDGFARYEAAIENNNLAPVGSYRSLIGITDLQDFPSPDYLDLIAYQIITLAVTPHSNEMPIASAGAGPQPQTVCEPVYFFDEGSTDPDGMISTYQWDWNNDGQWDESGASAEHTWDIPGTYEVQFRVTDNIGDSDILDEPLEIEIDNALPTAAASVNKLEVMENNPLHFDGSASHDNDCEGVIVLHEWDWNNDGDFEDTGVTASHAWPYEGIYEVQLRVTDDEGDVDLLNTPLEIHVVHNHGWAGTWGSSVNMDYAWGVAADPMGNVYVTGCVSGPADFDPGDGVAFYDDSNGRMYVSKFDADGEFQWVRLFGCLVYNVAWDVAADGQGNVYVVGEFEQQADFDPGPGEAILYAGEYYDGFILKLDANGNYQWAQNWDNGHESFSPHRMCVEASPAGDVYVCGFFKHELPWEGGIETNGGADAFLAKFNTDGVCEWAKTWGGTMYDQPDANPSDYASDLAIDTSGNIVVTGTFGGIVDFDPGPEAYIIEGTSDVFVTKFTPNGDHLWAAKWGEIGTNTNYYSYGIATDSANDIYICGRYYMDACLVKFSSDGVYQWLRYWGYHVLTYQWAFDVVVDSTDHVYVTGQTDTYAISGPIDFDPDPVDTDWITPLGRFNSFLCKYDIEGDYVWGHLYGSTNEMYDSMEGGRDLAIGPFDSIYVVGSYLGIVDFNPDPYAENWHQSIDNTEDAYLVKFLPNGYWQ